MSTDRLSKHVMVEADFSIVSKIKERQLWDDIRQAAVTNNALHEAMERVKIIYYLSKDNGNSKT